MNQAATDTVTHGTFVIERTYQGRSGARIPGVLGSRREGQVVQAARGLAARSPDDGLP